MSKQSVKIPAYFTMNNLFPEYICPCCKKHFVMPVGTDIKQYTYKMMIDRQTQYMCSYHCYRALTKVEEEKQETAKEARRIAASIRARAYAREYKLRKAAQA